MTKRYPFRSTFCGADTGDTGGLEGVAFGVFELSDGGKDFRRHQDEGASGGSPTSHGLGADVHHAGFAAGVIVGEFCHRIHSGISPRPTRRKAGCLAAPGTPKTPS